MDWKQYSIDKSFDETISSPGNARASSKKLVSFLRKLPDDELSECIKSAEAAIKTLGISFTVYSDGANIDREWPLDIIPRIIAAKEWETVEKGLTQRLRALNCFINDVYNDQAILKDQILPTELITESPNYRKECEGMQPAFGVWAHICGTDLIRDDKGRFLVLEDNLRVPSGVSYMLENRNVTKRILPELFSAYEVKPLRDYTSQLFDTLTAIAPKAKKKSRSGCVDAWDL